LAPPRSSPGLEPFLQAILQEQIDLNDYADKIRVTRERIEIARRVIQRGR
jgi:hypothetical protein